MKKLQPIGKLSLYRSATTRKQVLRKARKLLGTPGRWTRGTMYRDDRGHIVFVKRKAMRCCLIGALQAVSRTHNVYMDTWRLLDRFAIRRGEVRLSGFNDKQVTVRPVLKLLDEAIAD